MNLFFQKELKQIAGRAGRYGTQYEHGEVTCMTPEDLKYVRQGMQVLDDPVLKAGTIPFFYCIFKFISVSFIVCAFAVIQ